jgi:hypothetical protein
MFLVDLVFIVYDGVTIYFYQFQNEADLHEQLFCNKFFKWLAHNSEIINN